jgi:hypothetical protein
MKFFIISGLLLLLHQAYSQVKGNAISEEVYSSLDNWAAHPWKKDPSDSISLPLKKDVIEDSNVDVFFLHPTSYLSKKKQYGLNAPLSATDVNEVTDHGSIYYQASIFNVAGRVFAPRYRQAHLSAYYMDDKETANIAFELAYGDIRSAFLYYLNHFNQGRPFVIASHSQGTNHAIRLIQELVDTTTLRNKMVVAYLAGMAVPVNSFTNIKGCTYPQETGCVCSWRTYKEGYVPSFVKKEQYSVILTNPLSWSSSHVSADFSENPGAILWKFDNPIPAAAQAMNQGNVIWTKKPRFFGNILYMKKNYHAGDYNLYYISIRNNVMQRIGAYWK